MAIAKNPKRSVIAAAERQAQKFITGAGKPVSAENAARKTPIMVRMERGEDPAHRCRGETLRDSAAARLLCPARPTGSNRWKRPGRQILAPVEVEPNGVSTRHRFLTTRTPSQARSGHPHGWDTEYCSTHRDDGRDDPVRSARRATDDGPSADAHDNETGNTANASGSNTPCC